MPSTTLTADAYLIVAQGNWALEVADAPGAAPTDPVPAPIGALYRTSDGDLLDLICWAAYGWQSGAVEAVLEANRGLADLGPVYPAGVTIRLPRMTPPSAQPARLWD